MFGFGVVLAWAAHPRVGGENSAGLVSTLPSSGSSPRRRGKQVHLARRKRLPGLIPA